MVMTENYESLYCAIYFGRKPEDLDVGGRMLYKSVLQKYNELAAP
jgi:hypothetical protein